MVALSLIGFSAASFGGSQETVTKTGHLSIVDPQGLEVGAFIVTRDGAELRANRLVVVDKNGKNQFIDEVPIGTICAWPGELPPGNDPWWEHWRACDGGMRGKKLLFKGNERLAEILKPYGNDRMMTAESEIKLPDFRGYFLRGVDPSGTVDPGGKTHTVGSLQGDEIGDHEHDIRSYHLSCRAGKAGDGASFPTSCLAELARWDEHEDKRDEQERNLTRVARTGGIPGRPRLGQETRPKNYAVHWVIRIK